MDGPNRNKRCGPVDGLAFINNNDAISKQQLNALLDAIGLGFVCLAYCIRYPARLLTEDNLSSDADLRSKTSIANYIFDEAPQLVFTWWSRFQDAVASGETTRRAFTTYTYGVILLLDKAVLRYDFKRKDMREMDLRSAFPIMLTPRLSLKTWRFVAALVSRNIPSSWICSPIISF